MVPELASRQHIRNILPIVDGALRKAGIALPDLDGMEVFRRIRRADAEVPVLIMTAYGTVTSAVKALQEGVYDYITKPLDRVCSEVDRPTAALIKERNPNVLLGFVGAKVAVQPAQSLAKGLPVDFVARNEFDFTVKEVAEGRDFAAIDGISWRNNAGVIMHNKDRAILEDMDQLPFVTEVDAIFGGRPLQNQPNYTGRLRIGGVKIVMDGSPQGKTAFFTTPYLTGGPAGAPPGETIANRETPPRTEVSTEPRQTRFARITVRESSIGCPSGGAKAACTAAGKAAGSSARAGPDEASVM